MSDESDGKFPVRVEIGARADAKLEIKTEIPTKSAGRFVDALVDIFRPFSEKRGLRADQIRLQREEVLIEIAKKAVLRSQIENTEIKPIPNKFLVPFLERASLEELDSVLLDRWADLLLSASVGEDQPSPRFISVLAELGGEQVKALKMLTTMYRSKTPFTFVEDSPLYDSFSVQSELNLLAKVKHESLDDLYSKMINEIEIPGFILSHVFFEIAKIDEAGEYHHELIDRDFDYSIAILESLGLVKTWTLYYNSKTIINLTMWICQLTAFGLEFLYSCDRELKAEIDASYARSGMKR